MRRKPGLLRRAGKWFGVFILLLVGVIAAALLWLRQTVAPLSGQQELAGLGARVEILMGREAVPHIYAATALDAYQALGFLHAQNRLWQMELMRRAGQGRLSEIFGDSTLARDRLMRTFDLHGHARRSVDALSPRGRASLEAYARGVNDWITRPTNISEPRLPPEFRMLAHQPEPWEPADSVLVVKMMAIQLSRNMDKEIDRLTFAALGLSPAEIEDLMPTERTWGAPPLPDLRALYPLVAPAEPVGRRRSAVYENIGDGASNNWVVSGAQTKSGQPLLANDPHLRLSAPSVWYLVHVAIGPKDKPFNLVGASLPGTPLVPIGRGDTLAWGLTNTESDVQDLYVEKINPDNPGQYLTPDGWRDFGRETVSIRVRGGDEAKLERLTTRHGPVISSVYRGLDAMIPGHVVALQWPGLSDDDVTLEAGLFDTSIRTVADAVAQTRHTVGPMQTMVIGDTQGTIAMLAPARFPRRNPANAISGRAPVPGWDPVYDWQGFVSVDELPRTVRKDGVLASSNTRIVPSDYPHVLTWDWGVPYRQQRIEALVSSKSGHDRASMRAAQLDVQSPLAVKLKPLMIAAARTAGAAETAMLELLERWDGGMRGGEAAP
ncbi:MAG TPA: penicillin acylase family protein, partial [Hyphomicrobiaceae bacterium]|nr:penicillin acylase family protein [Hyphomicrobiaceae bacterium]